jgi:hypothetical protein
MYLHVVRTNKGVTKNRDLALRLWFSHLVFLRNWLSSRIADYMMLLFFLWSYLGCYSLFLARRVRLSQGVGVSIMPRLDYNLFQPPTSD